MFGATPRYRHGKDVGSAGKRLWRGLQRDDEEYCRSWNERPQQILESGISRHVIVTGAPAEDQIACIPEIGLQCRRKGPADRRPPRNGSVAEPPEIT